MIYLTEVETGYRIPVFLDEICAVKEGPASDEAGSLSGTRVFISDRKCATDACLIVKETPQEIGTLMIQDLMDAGEDIKEHIFKEDISDGELSEDYRPRV